jgi:hypothetical protein
MRTKPAQSAGFSSARRRSSALGGVDVWVWPVQTLASGQSLTFTVRVKLTKTGIVLALATVGSETRDPELPNNLTVALTTVK